MSGWPDLTRAIRSASWPWRGGRDPASSAHGTPSWVDTRAPLAGAPGTAAWQHLLVAQDTGSGILGAVRGDIYWGDDASAAALGGRMGGEGRYWLLLPSGVTQ